MLRITIELLPSGGGPPERIGVGYISNDGTGTTLSGNYDGFFFDAEGNRTHAWIKGFRRSRAVWDLVLRALFHRSRSEVDSRVEAEDASWQRIERRLTRGE